MSKRITIAIDGYSSTGKSTIARRLAGELEYVYVDTGAMYRAMTLYAMRQPYLNKEHFNKKPLIRQLPFIKLEFIFDKEQRFGAIHLNGENVEREIRLLEVSRNVSKVAAVPEVRKKLVLQQQALGKEKAVVMDGRDIGTVVFPDAELKIFIIASTEIRAKRRYDELKSRGDKISYDDVLENVKERDYLDTTREDSPLIKADDAIEIDNSLMNLEEQYEKVLKLAKEKIAE